EIRKRLGDGFEVVEVSNPGRALAELPHDNFIGIYADSDHFSEAIDVGRFIQNERILSGMPDGVVVLLGVNTILWGSGRLRETTGREDVIGANFYEVLGNTEIIGPDFCPFHTALSTGKGSASTLRCDHRYFRVHAIPVLENGTPAKHLIVTVRDVTSDVL